MTTRPSCFRAKKTLGQHFLTSRRIAEQIAELARIEDEVVLEIGAGKGILTKEIARCARELIALEIDPRLVQYLETLALPNTKIINRDFLKIEIESLNKPVIIGNIPYSITTPILERLVNKRRFFKRAILTVQKEYGERLLAETGSRKYGSITVFVNYYFDLKKELAIPARYFSPRPRVNSMVLSFFNRKPLYKVDNEKMFFAFIKGIFCYRRKLLKNAIRNYLKVSPEILESSILERRPEELTIDEYIDIFKKLGFG